MAPRTGNCSNLCERAAGRVIPVSGEITWIVDYSLITLDDSNFR
jgi:hypothetical protein